MVAYADIVVETYCNFDNPSRSDVRVRPVAGQRYSPKLHVECSKTMRSNHAIGTKFLLKVCEKRKAGGDLFLYSSWQWSYEVLSEASALERMRKFTQAKGNA